MHTVDGTAENRVADDDGKVATDKTDAGLEGERLYWMADD